MPFAQMAAQTRFTTSGTTHMRSQPEGKLARGAPSGKQARLAKP